MNSSTVLVRSFSSFDPHAARQLEVVAGETLAELLRSFLPALHADQFDRLEVCLVLNGQAARIPKAHWRLVRPRPGVLVTVGYRVRGNDSLRAILQLAVVVAATLVAGPAGGALSGAVGGAISSKAATAIVHFAVTTAGFALVNALVPVKPPGLSGGRDSLTYSLSGGRNSLAPWGVVPAILGEHRIYPPYAAAPYTEMVGDDQYLRLLFLVGYGPLEISDIRIGETPIADFDDVETEIREGYDTDGPVTLYPGQVVQDDFSVALTYDFSDGWQRRTSPDNVDELSIDILFPAGLVYIEDGKRKYTSVDINIRYRKVGDTAWTNVPDLSIRRNVTTPFRTGKRWAVAERAQYEVEVRRDTIDSTGDHTANDTVWTALRGIRNEDPVDFPVPVAVIAMRIRASEQLNSVIDELSLLARSVVEDYDSASDSWVTRPSRNPASLFRHVLTAPANAQPQALVDIPLAELQEWHSFCVTHGLSYDRVHDYDSSVYDVLSDVAAAGRAAPSFHRGQWGVVVDEPKSLPMGMITARTGADFSGEIAYRSLPDAFRVVFVDRTADYKRSERIVLRPGVSDLPSSPGKYELIEFPGKTDPLEVWIEARRRFAEATHRFETFYATIDWGQMIYRRGDLVLLNHPVISELMGTARVRQVSGRALVLEAEFEMDPEEDYRLQWRDGANSWHQAAIERRGGTDRIVTVAGGEAVPAVSTLVMIGKAGEEVFEALVKDVEPQADFRARLALVPHVPDLETLADIGAPPAWTSPVGSGGSGPAIPVIIAVSDTISITAGPEGEPILLVELSVTVAAGGGGDVLTSQIEVQVREVGADWRSQTVDLSVQTAVFTETAEMEDFEIRARAISADGALSGWSDPVIHSAGDGGVFVPTPTGFEVAETADGTRVFDWEAGSGLTYQIRLAPGSGRNFEEMKALFSGGLTAAPYQNARPRSTGDHTAGITVTNSVGVVSDPVTIDVTLGSSPLGDPLHQTDESGEGWTGTIVGGVVNGGVLEGTAGTTLEYRRSFDLGADTILETPLVYLFGVTGAVSAVMRTGSDADGSATGSEVEYEPVTARYVEIIVRIDDAASDPVLSDMAIVLQEV